MARWLVELLVGRPRARLLRPQSHFANDLALIERCGEHIDEEPIQVDVALAAGADRAYAAAQRQHHRRKIAGRVGVGKCASQRALRPHLWVAYLVSCFGEHWRGAVDHVRELDLAVGGHRADRQLTILAAHVRQARNASDVHQ